MIIVETRAFTARIDDILDAEEYRALQLQLLERPAAGKVIQGAGGLRKLRWGAEGRGKRGGIRIIYYWHVSSETVLMLFVFAKKDRADLTATQREALRRLVEREYPS